MNAVFNLRNGTQRCQGEERQAAVSSIQLNHSKIKLGRGLLQAETLGREASAGIWMALSSEEQSKQWKAIDDTTEACHCLAC